MIQLLLMAGARTVLSRACVDSGGMRKHTLMQQSLGAGTYFLQVVSILQISCKANGFQIFMLDAQYCISNPTCLFSCAFLLAAAEDVSNVSTSPTLTTEYEAPCLSKSS